MPEQLRFKAGNSVYDRLMAMPEGETINVTLIAYPHGQPLQVGTTVTIIPATLTSQPNHEVTITGQ